MYITMRVKLSFKAPANAHIRFKEIYHVSNFNPYCIDCLKVAELYGIVAN